MRNIITQNYTGTHSKLFELTTKSTQSFATKNGFEYITSNISRCTGEKATQHAGWEKIAWLNEFLPTIENGSLVIYADCDSIFLNGNFGKALDIDYELGMVKLRGGLGGAEVLNWFNTGVMVMYNTPNVRKFFLKIWSMNEMNEEIALKKELKASGNIIGNSTGICSLDPAWNCWSNNEKFVSTPYIKTFHGMNLETKLSAIATYLKNLV